MCLFHTAKKMEAGVSPITQIPLQNQCKPMFRNFYCTSTSGKVSTFAVGERLVPYEAQ